MGDISFGLLDFGYREETMGSLRIQMDTIEYALTAEKFGFTRYWLAEHYFTKRRLAWSNPAPLISIIASMTNTIKVGSAGILLGIHQPFHIANYFKFVNNLFPDRIDLGVANGAVSPTVAKSATGSEDTKNIRDNFNGKFAELLRFLRKEDDLLEEGEGLVLPPFKGLIPEVWSLSVSNHGLKRALDLKVNFARSIFHLGSDLNPDKEMLLEFRSQYFEQHGIHPKVTLAVSGCCQETELEAKRITAGLQFSDELNIVASSNQFYDTIKSYQEAFGVDEFIFKDIARSPVHRIKTLEIISEKFNLN